MYRLPAEPSKLIRVSLEDLEAVEDDPDYRVDMDAWHTPMFRSECQVCLAGAVMAKRLGVEPDEYIATPTRSPFTRKERAQLVALDEFRRGDVYSGLYRLVDAGLVAHSKVDLVRDADFDPSSAIMSHVPAYGRDPSAFKAAMSRIAQELEEYRL